MALEQHDNTLCPCGCGYPAAVSQAPENEDRFEMDLPIRCHARTAMAQAMSRVGEGDYVAEALLFERPRLRD